MLALVFLFFVSACAFPINHTSYENNLMYSENTNMELILACEDPIGCMCGENMDMHCPSGTFCVKVRGYSEPRRYFCRFFNFFFIFRCSDMSGLLMKPEENFSWA